LKLYFSKLFTLDVKEFNEINPALAVVEFFIKVLLLII
jgi:hypothetical protein